MTVRIVLILCVSVAAMAQPSQWKEVSTFKFQWKKNQPPYEFSLEIPQGWADAGDFIRVRVQPPHPMSEFTLIDSGGFVKISTQLENAKLRSRNLAKSEYLYFSPDLTQMDHTPSLILFGWQYASTPGAIHILQLDAGGQPHEVFSKDFYITDIVDLDKDGTKEVVGVRGFAEEWDHYETYNPYFVYRSSPRRPEAFKYSLQLSEKYNKTHYYGWMGPDFSEEIVVVHGAPGHKKPVVMRLKDAQKLFGE